MLTRKELQTKLRDLESSKEIVAVNLNAKTAQLRAIYDDYLDQKKPEPIIQKIEPIIEEPEPVVINCSVCGALVVENDNWLICGNCHHRKPIAS